MKHLVGRVAILLSTSLAAASCTQLPREKSISGQESNVGSVIIYDKQLNRSCTLKPIKDVNEVYRFGKTKYCSSLPNDEAYYFRFDGVPSAVLVTFYDSPDCNGVSSFVFRVRTMQSPTTTEEMKLSAAHSKPEGGMLAPGLRLEFKRGTGQVDGRLSCVRIEY